MSEQLDVVKKRLFDKEGLAATNFKVFPGISRDSTSEQMAEQINKALAQIEVGDYDSVEED